MPDLERVHLGRPPRLAAGLHHAGNRVVHPQERHRPTRPPATGQFFMATAQGGEVGTRPAAELEQHRLAAGQFHDVFHRVTDGLDETGGALRVLVLGIGTLDGLALAVEIEITGTAAFADPVLVVQTAVKPHGRVERAVLIDAQPGQFMVKRLGILRGGEVTLVLAPSRQSSG